MRIVREIAVAILFVALAAAMTWPLAVNLPSAISDPGDPLLTTWTMDWEWFALTHHRHVFDAPVFAPSEKTLAFSENIFGTSILFFPLFAAGVAPLTINNLAMLLGFAASGWAMFLLARFVTQSIPASIVAGIVYAFIGYRFIHITHLMYVWSPWLPLLLLAFLAFDKTPSLRNAALFGGAFVMNGLSSLHWFVFGSVAIGITALVLCFRRGARFWLLLGGATLIAMLLLAPMLGQYLAVDRMYGFHRSAAELLPNSATWSDWWHVHRAVRSTAALGMNTGEGERCLFPGLLATLLAIGAFVMPGVSEASGGAGGATGRRRRAALPSRFLAPLGMTLPATLWLLIGALGARGVRGAFGSFLFHYVPGFAGIRMPVRWVMIAYVGIALLVAIALANRHRALVFAIGVAMLLEYRVAPIRWYLMPSEPRPLYTWLRDAPFRGNVLELPMTQQMAYEYHWHSTVHHRPLINGVSSYAPPGYEALAASFDAPSDAVLDELASRNCSLVVVHEGALREHGRELLAFLRRELDRGQLTFVRRFPAGTRADWLFALTRIEPHAASWRAPEVPDRAGRTPSQNLAIFLGGGGWTYNDAMFGMISDALAGTIRGKLMVRGWAVAPSGIRRASLRFANGRVVVPANLIPRDDIAEALPWYPKTNNGFLNFFDEPPHGIDGDTDLQVELEDNAGHVLRLRPQWFRWLR